jgi:LPS O-antigen subunit length determinant protein (WzzB/FepE family)
MSGVIVIVGINGDDYQLILKNNYKVFSVTSDFLNQIHATQKLFHPWTQDEYKISNCEIKDKNRGAH